VIAFEDLDPFGHRTGSEIWKTVDHNPCRFAAGV
jgi:hypothetical protein